MADLTDESDYVYTLDEATLQKAKDELNESEKEVNSCIKTFRELVKQQQAWLNAPLDESDYVYTLDEATLQKAKDELNESEKEVNSCIKTFRELVKQQQAWLNAPLGTRFLLKYLRTQKFSQLAAKTRLENFMTFRSETPQWFCNKDTHDKNIQELLGCGFVLRLPKPDKRGRIVIMSRPGQLDVKRIKKDLGGIDTVFRTFSTVLDWILMDERAQINGIVIIIDQTGFSLEHKTEVYTTENFRKLSAILQNANPFRVKEFHFYNMPPIFEALFAVLKQFLKQKFRDRITVHGKNLTSLYEKIDMSVLPEEYLPDDYTGPNSSSIQNVIDYMRESLKTPEVTEFIKSLTSNYTVNLDKKPKDNLHPVASFRKLNVD